MGRALDCDETSARCSAVAVADADGMIDRHPQAGGEGVATAEGEPHYVGGTGMVGGPSTYGFSAA
jgi:hypothetical protein